MRTYCLLAVLLGCSSASPETSTPEASERPEALVSPSPAPSPSTTPSPSHTAASDAECAEMIRDYLARREALNHCDREDDCAQIWPGLCPHGAYFIHQRSDLPSVVALARQIGERCTLPECEPPMHLAPAGCRAGRCVAGGRSRVPPAEPMESCWDTPMGNLENGDAASSEIQEDLRGTTPLHVYGVPSAGRLTIEARWPAGCGDTCRLDISEHNSGMSRLVEGVRSMQGSTQTIELPVTEGDYFLVGRGPSAAGSVLLRVEHLASDGTRPASTRHGRAVKRLCEG